MAVATQLAETKVVTADGVVTATLVDRVGPDRITLMLMRGFASAKYGGTKDETPLVSPEIRSLLIHPKAEDG